MKLRKLLALVLALVMALSGGVVAFAEGDDPGEGETLGEAGKGEGGLDEENGLSETLDEEGDEEGEANGDPNAGTTTTQTDYNQEDLAALAEILTPYWDKLPQQFKTDNGLNAVGDLDDEVLKQDIQYYDEEDYNWQFHIVWASPEDGSSEDLRVIDFTADGLGLTGKLDVSKLTALKYLWCRDNQLTSLDLSGCAALEQLFCEINQLSSLDVSNCTKLDRLSCFDNQLTSLNPSNCTELTYLDCEINQIPSLDLSKCAKLEILFCGNNQLTSLDLSNCTALQALYLDSNQLTSLDVSMCKELEKLSAWGNLLTSLNVSGCSKLQSLDVYDNRLTELDLSSCPAMTSLDCRYNDLPGTDAVKLASSLNVVWESWTVDERGHAIPGYLFTPQGRIPEFPTHEPVAGDDEGSQAGELTVTERANEEAQETAMEAIEDYVSGNTAVKVQTVATASGASVTAIPVKLYGTANLGLEIMETVSDAGVGLNVDLDNGAAEILIPSGFTIPYNPRRVYYPLGFQQNPYYADLMMERVKEAGAKTEVCCLGAGTLPTSVTVTLKTKLTGTVNVYYWDEATRRVTLLGSGAVQNGKVVFATKQLGNLIITTGTI